MVFVDKMMIAKKASSKPLPHRPIMGGTNNGERLIYFDYWRVGQGGRGSYPLDFWVEQAGEYHCKAGFVTGNYTDQHWIHVFYHLAGDAVFEYTQRSIPISPGMMVIIPANQTFYYRSQQIVKYHWFALGGHWPSILGEIPAIRLLPVNDSEVEAKFANLREILILNKPGFPLQAISVFYGMMARIEEMTKQSIAPQSLYPEAVRKAIIFLHENHVHPFSAADTANAVNLSQSHLRALFEKWLGESPKQFHTRTRIDYAKRLLAEQHLAISEVALQVGFTDVRHFLKVFKQVTGVTPSQYKK